MKKGLMILAALTIAACAAEPDKAAPQAPAPQTPKTQPEQVPATTAARHVIIISVDTLRPDHLGVYGHQIKTPVIDKLAREGTLFSQATTPFPRTTPALASLQTGLWPQHHGSREVNQPMKEKPTIASILAGRGFQTLALSANPAASKYHNLHLGFSQFLDASGIIMRQQHKEGTEDLSFAEVMHAAGGMRQLMYSTSAGAITEITEDMNQEADNGKPLFLWVHYDDPHWPYDPPPEWKATHPATPLCEALLDQFFDGKTSFGVLVADQGGESSRALDQCKAAYDSEISYADHHIGKLLEGLRQAGYLDHALVIVTSDHGEHLGEDGIFFEHGPSVHDAGLRIPLIVWGPEIGLPINRIDDKVARLEDILPTIMTLVDVPNDARPEVDGADLSYRLRKTSQAEGQQAPFAYAESGTSFHPQLHQFLITGNMTPTGTTLGCVNGPQYSLCWTPGKQEPSQAQTALYDHINDPEFTQDLSNQKTTERVKLLAATKTWQPEQARQRTIRTTSYKLVTHPLLDGRYRSVLYDLLKDPQETQDVSRQHPKVAETMGAALNKWESGIESYIAPQRTNTELEMLRSLGYIE